MGKLHKDMPFWMTRCSVAVPLPNRDRAMLRTGHKRSEHFPIPGHTSHQQPLIPGEYGCAYCDGMVEWQARMVTPAVDLVAPVFRREVSLDSHGAVSSAALHVSSLGMHEAFIDGVPVSPDVLTPGWSALRVAAALPLATR